MNFVTTGSQRNSPYVVGKEKLERTNDYCYSACTDDKAADGQSKLLSIDVFMSVKSKKCPCRPDRLRLV